METNQVHTLSTGLCRAEGEDIAHVPSSAVLDALFDSGEEEVRRICLAYQGSKPQHARMEIQGVPTEGVVDTGADITIIGGDLFK